MIGDVRGRSVLIIGGTRGIGNAIARRFAQCGARVTLTGRDESRARAAAAAIGDEAIGLALDVRERAAVTSVITETAALGGMPAALIYCAGISPAYTSAEKLGATEWDEILATNLTGAFLAAQAFARAAVAAAKPGSIVLIGSIAGLVGAGRLAAYAASKAALTGLAKSMAWDWARYGIRVNVLAPGWVQTEMTAGVRSSESLSQMIAARTPQARMASPDEIADLAIYLASDSASFATGAVFTLDGGWTAG